VAAKQQSGVLFMDKKYGVGIDIKFQRDAKVYVITGERVSRDVMMQYVGRGSRSCEAYQGHMFSLGAPSMASGIQNFYNEYVEDEFYDAAEILSALEALLRANHQAIVKKLFQKHGNKFKMYLDEYTECLNTS
jgi:hypothetical protein